MSGRFSIQTARMTFQNAGGLVLIGKFPSVSQVVALLDERCPIAIHRLNLFNEVPRKLCFFAPLRRSLIILPAVRI